MPHIYGTPISAVMCLEKMSLFECCQGISTPATVKIYVGAGKSETWTIFHPAQ